MAILIAAVAAILLFLLANPWVELEQGTILQVVTVAFWASFLLLLLALFEDRKSAESKDVEIEGPASARFLFNYSRAGLFWLPIRLFVGFSWLESGWGKATNPDNAWLGGGSALRAYWERAAAIPDEGRPPITFEWYRDFINTLLNNNA